MTVTRIACRKRRHAGNLELEAERHLVHQDPDPEGGNEREKRARVKARAFDEDGKESPGIKEPRLREAEALRIAHRTLHGPGEKQLRHVDEHEAHENFVRMEAVTQKGRDAAPHGAPEGGGEHDENHEGGARRRIGAKRHGAARDRARDQLPFGADVPDVRAEAHHQPHRAEEKRRHLDGDFRPTTHRRKRFDEEGAKRHERILTEQHKEHGARNHRQQKRHGGAYPAKRAGGLGPRRHLNGKIHAASSLLEFL